METSKRNSILGVLLCITLVIATLAVQGKLFKGSFDAFDAAKDFKIEAFKVIPELFVPAENKDLQISYTLQKNAHNIFLSIASPSKKQKFIPLTEENRKQGASTITISNADIKDFLKDAGDYKVTIIAYNADNEISDVKTVTIKSGAAQQVAAKTNGIHKTTTEKPSRVSIVKPKSDAVINVEDYKNEPQRIVITWKDETNLKTGARQSDANGNIMMNYRWKLMQGKVSSVKIEETEGIKGASYNWEGDLPTYYSGGDTQSSSESCIVSMKSDGSTTYSPRWTCTETIIPYSVLNSLIDGNYTLAIQAGDGINGSIWAYSQVTLKNTESTKKAYEQQQTFFEAEKKAQEILLSIAQENGDLANLAEAITVEQKFVEKVEYGNEDEITAVYRIKLDPTYAKNGLTYRDLTLTTKVDGKTYKTEKLLVNAQSIYKMFSTFIGDIPQQDPDNSITTEVKFKIDAGVFSFKKMKEKTILFDFKYINKNGESQNLTTRVQKILPALVD